MLAAAANDPFPPSWVRSATFQWCVSTKNGGVLWGQGCLTTTDRLDALNSKPLTPVLSPPSNLQIDGRAAFDLAERSLTSLTPVVSWAPPRMGSPTMYRVRVREVSVGSKQVATLVTPRTSVTLPPGLLTVHGKYAFRVEAYQGANRVERPLASQWPEYTAETTSSVFAAP